MICTDLQQLTEELRRRLDAGDFEGSERSVARDARISSTHLHNFKIGEREFSFEKLDRLANRLGVKYTLKNH